MGRLFLIALVIGISVLFFKMIRSFVMALIIAGIFASLAQPLYRRTTKLLRGRRRAAAIVVLVVVVLVVLLPLAGLLGLVTAEAINVGETAVPWVQDKLNNPYQMEMWLRALPFYERIEPYRDDIMMRAGQAVDFASRLLINSLSAATSGTLNFLFMLGVMLYAMYFFLEGGGRLVDRILFYLPLDDAEERLLLDRFRSVARATLKGTAVIGLLQGTLAGIAFAVAGVPSAAFWGALMVALSVVPGIGIGLVWVPASIVLVAGGHTLEGVLLALFCGGVVGSIDNVLRPRLVGKDTKLPDLLILLSTIGGISMFGMLGLIVGPILAALFVTVWEIYGRVFADVLPAGGPDGGPPDEPA
ncbi:MAG: AI-2E family transporter [bacterium]|nr:AI-2E family transporter [bacterium]